MVNPLPQHATILIQPVSPPEASHALQLARDIRGQGAEDGGPDVRWTIDNKYYSADVGFRILDQQEVYEDGEEPVVIVLAARDKRPSDALSPLLKRLAARSTEFDVALLVSIPSSPSASTSIDEEAWEDLAMDHDFEWVDLVSNERQNGRAGVEDREEGGLRRVGGALQAHMWEGMVPKPRDGAEEKEGQGLRREDEPALDSDEDEDLSALGAPPLPSPRPYAPTSMSFPDTFLPSLKSKSGLAPSSDSASAERTSFDDDFAPFVPALHSSHTSFPPLPSAAPTSSPPVSAALYRHPELAFPDTESLPISREAEEGDDDDLEAMIAKLKGVREVAMGLDMEARRALAEKTVLGLFGGAVDCDDDEK